VFRYIWRFLGSINLAIWLLVLIALNLAVGSLYARLYPKVIGRLDYLRFQDWISPAVLPEGWWILLLFFMLFFLGVNTVVCTFDRVLLIVGKRQPKHPGALFLDLAPSLMHVCFIVAILGHALSQFTWEEIKLPVHPGTAIALSAGSLTVDNQVCNNWEEPGLEGYVKQCSATLVLQTSNQSIRKEVSILHPIFWEDYGIHLKMTGNPKPGESPRLNLVIKRDPGLIPMLWGGAFFCILIVWYFITIFKSRRGGA